MPQNTLFGSNGDDIFLIENADDVVIEGPGGGLDSVYATVSNYTLSNNVERLSYIGTGNFSGVGNTSDNLIQGGAGNDTLQGLAGNDTLIGGVGNDVYIVEDSGDVILEASGAGVDSVLASIASYSLLANVETLSYTGTGNFTGVGNALDNLIQGGVGNDTLSGGAGNDTLLGGLGNDVYIVDDAGDVVTELAGEGSDEVRTNLTSYSLSANVETLSYIGTGNFTGVGNALDNLIQGGVGNDTLVGGLGNDVYIVDDAGDVVTELAGEGSDEVRTSLSSYALSANVETLSYTGTGNFTGVGNALDNLIQGGAGNDTLSGGVGNDTLVGGLGNDVYIVDDAGDAVTELAGEGSDEVRTSLSSYGLSANVETLTYTGTGNFTGVGNALDNLIRGGSGNDTLSGGAGNDALLGGLGNDVYTVDDAGDVVTELAGEGSDEVRTSLSSY
ncbi:calcium-binding protein, partial [Azospirillum griseum]|uniref:calcium-binding protein n=1 Tax=Azospirillum griseum TaxID=2496639 RepID=UPI0036364D9A